MSVHPVIVNPVINPIVGISNVPAWEVGQDYPSSLALLWRDTLNAKPLRYITFNGKYLVVKNV